MKAWFKVHAALRRLLNNPDVALRLARSLDREAKLFMSPEKQIEAWEGYLEAMAQAHIFEFDDDVSFLMTLTDNHPSGEIKLPYPIVWLDVEFDIQYKNAFDHVIGILVYDSNFPVIHHDDGPIERLENVKPAVAFLKESNNLVVEMITPIGDSNDFRFTQMGRQENKMISNMVLNFLDLLETPDVMIVPVKRKHIGRKLLGNAGPQSDKVIIRASVRRYIEKLKAGGMFHYSHRFWVRGHWRHYRSLHYKNKAGTKDWIHPFIKGEGILIKKTYVIPDDKRIQEEL